MKNLKKLLTITTILTGLFSGKAFSETASGTASATVLTPIAVAATTALQFGQIVSSATAGTISQAGVVTGGVTATTSTRNAGIFTVTGDSTGSVPYTFTIPATATIHLVLIT